MLQQFWSHTNDDTFISLRYVENLSRGNGLVYNVGERVEAFTNLLWILLITAANVFVRDPLLTAKVLGLVCSFVVVLVVLSAVNAFAAGDADLSYKVKIVLFAMFGTHAPFWAWAVGGLEASLYTLLLLLVAYYFVPSGPRPKSSLWAVASVGLALTRPEGIAVSFLIIVTSWIVEKRVSFRPLFRWGCVAISVYLFVRLACFFYFHHVFPTSYLIRVGDSGAAYLGKRISVGITYVTDYARYYMLYIPFSAIVVRLAAGHWLKTDRDRKHSRLLLYIMVGVIGSVIITAYFGGDSKIYYRLLVPIFPLLAVGFALALNDLFTLWMHRRFTNVVVVGFTIIFSSSLVVRNPVESDERNWSRFNKEHELLLERTMIGMWVKDHTSSNVVILASVAGTAPFFSGRTAHDGSLTQYSLAQRPPTLELGRYGSYAMTGHAKYYLEDVIKEERPCVIVGGMITGDYRRIAPFPGFRVPIALRRDCQVARIEHGEEECYLEEAFRRLHYTKPWRSRLRSELTSKWKT